MDNTEEITKLIKTILGNENLKSKNTAEIAPTDAKQIKTVTAAEIKDEIKEKEDVDVKPERPGLPTIAKRIEIAAPLLRFPLITQRKPQISAFTPCAMNCFIVQHYMDTLMGENSYFLDQEPLWNSMISRLYTSLIFYYQTLRCMDYAKIGSQTTKNLIKAFIQDYPPERFPVPGPILPIMKSLSVAEPTDKTFGIVTPRLPELPGPQTANALLSEAHLEMLLLPNMPIMAGILNDMMQPDERDYTTIEAFSNEANFEINGHEFEAQNWNQAERDVWLQPGMTHALESPPETNSNFLIDGGFLRIPEIQAATELSTIRDYLLLVDTQWIDNLIPIMTRYSMFFKESGNLGQCSITGPTAGLIRSRPTTLTSGNAQANIAFNLTHWGNEIYPFRLVYDQRSFEMNIPQLYQAMGQYASINTSTVYRGMGVWNNLNTVGHGRSGPYWDQHPSYLRYPEDKGMLEVEQIVNNHYFIEDPSSKN